MKFNAIKVVSVVLIVLLIVNMVLFAMKRSNTVYFWVFIILAAIYAFLVLPKLKANKKKELENKVKKSRK
ncbi:MAG: hypothetical protein ABII01_01525 [Candidatus Woesearchaeota archaeon]